MDKISNELHQISSGDLNIISNVLRIVESYVHDYKYCKDESTSNYKRFRNVEFEEGAGIEINLQKDSIWFQSDDLFLHLNCMEYDSTHRKFVEDLVAEKLMKLVK